LPSTSVNSVSSFFSHEGHKLSVLKALAFD
jgi:hypothetical protein